MSKSTKKQVDFECEKTITYNSTGIQIHPYKRNQSRFLENITSTTITNGNMVYNLPLTGYYMKELSMFVTHDGFDTKFMQSQFPDYRIIVNRTKNGAKIPTYDFDDITLNQLQYEIVSKTIKSRKNKIYLNLPTATGKTIIGIYLILTVFCEKAFIICYKTEILKQWIKSITTKTGIDPSKVVLLNSSAQLECIYENNFKNQDGYIFLATPSLFNSYGNRYGWDRLDTIFKNLKIGVKIYDEAHRNIPNIVKIDAFTNVNRNIYLSAELRQADDEKTKLYKALFKNGDIFGLSQEKINDLKYTNAIVIHYNTDPTPMDRSLIFESNGHGFSKFEFMRYELKQGILLEAAKHFVDVIESNNEYNSRILILVSLIEHVDLLYKDFNSIYNDKYIVGRYHSKMDSEEKKMVLDSANIIISTYQSFSTGIDLEGDKIGHILSLDQVNEIEDNQSAGRGRRDERFTTFYYIFVDDSFSYCLRKLKRRLKYLYDQKIKQIFSMKYERI